MSEGPLNLNWGTIMKTVNDDPAEFFREGGWAFLAIDSDAEESEASESASEYVGSDADSGSESGSSFDDDASDDSGSAEASDEDEDMSDIAEDDESD